MFRWVTKGHGARETIWPHGCQSSMTFWWHWEQLVYQRQTERRGQNSLKKVSLEEEQRKGGMNIFCTWARRNWLIIVTAFFIVVDTLSKIFMQTSYVYIGAFVSSLATAGFAYIIAGLQENGHGSKLSFLHKKCEGTTSIEYAGEIKVVIIADDSLLVTTEGTEQQILEELRKVNEGFNRIAEAIEQKEVDLSGL